MEIKEYAPVVIPTLNRYEHFKRCFDSLERCTGADKTDVYVGLDFPPSQKYAEGWKQIDDYLKDKEKCNGFRCLYVRRREHNCGVGGPNSNESLLIEEIKDNYPVYIFTEDDNEFSPNFLDYINKGLCEYNDRDDVMAVSGYLFLQIEEMHPSKAFLSPFSNAWGSGYWTRKDFYYNRKGKAAFIEEVLQSWKLSLRLYKKRAASLNGFLSMHFRNQYYGDVMKTAEMLLYNKYSLFPSISKVRNWGQDGSGVHCGSAMKNIYTSQVIDKSLESEDIKNVAITEIAHLVDFPILKRVVVLMRYFGYKLTGKDLLFLYWKFK